MYLTRGNGEKCTVPPCLRKGIQSHCDAKSEFGMGWYVCTLVLGVGEFVMGGRPCGTGDGVMDIEVGMGGGRGYSMEGAGGV